MDAKNLRAIKKECRKLAHELMLERYKLYDEIWWGRIRISEELRAHGKEIIREINLKMPNLLTHDSIVSPLDIVSERYGFETPSDLIDYLLAYSPRKEVENTLYEQLLDQYLAVPVEEDWPDDVPF